MSPVSEENGLLAEGSGESDVAVVVTDIEGGEASGGKASLALALQLQGESLVLQIVRQIKNPVLCEVARGRWGPRCAGPLRDAMIPAFD